MRLGIEKRDGNSSVGYHISGHIPGIFRLRGHAAQIPFKFENSCDNIGVYHSRAVIQMSNVLRAGY